MSSVDDTGKATFRTTLWASGGNNVGIVVPDEVVLGFGRGRRVPVVVTIDDSYTYRTTIASMGGRYLVTFNAETRRATGRGAGDEIEVALTVDDAPRTVEVPAALAEALRSHPDAAEAWAQLSYSKQRAHALSVDGAKTDDTRDRRVEKVLAALAAG
ncbi:DUF1905 domain-containing protein [Actinotalea sp. BY-33]|uniref:DUF1905 domain-containing protein n=1 Tax=Actinotalea soli TaxID=2819234 RepID=A0A939RSL9_9CELL|nr:YdeI/OmpD-associated family protein [Actinotalea soli]MBO1751762.1 DUF1905 domain-containing protein [Actinotalea soli]